MVGRDRYQNKIGVGDLVLVDFRASFKKNSQSWTRSIGEVVSGDHFGFSDEEYFVRVSKPQDDKVVYLEVNSWSSYFEKVEKKFSENITSLYF